MRGKIVGFAIAFEASLIVLAWGLGWILEAPPFDQVHMKWGALGWGTVATVPAMFAMLWCIRLPWRAFRRLVIEVEENVIPLFLGSSPFQLILLSLVAGIGEEALFRGVLQGWLGSLMNRWVALGITSLLFGLGHFITPTYAILAGLLGFYLGGLSIVYGNLLVAMVAHALYDYVALNYLLWKHNAHGMLVPDR